MVNIYVPHNNQMSVYSHTCVMKWPICYRTYSVHVCYKVVECIMHDIDQCKISGILYAKMLVIHGQWSFDYYGMLITTLSYVNCEV